MTSKLRPVRIIQQSNKPSGTVIFFHGSGDSGQGIRQWIKLLLGNDMSFPHLRVIFPTAPVRPYTPLNGEETNVWFDRIDIAPTVPEHKDTLDSICNDVTEFIKEEIATTQIPIERIVIGGFSMGGALALHMGYRIVPNVAGIFALSAFLNNGSGVYDAIQASNKKSPLFMCHGNQDTLVPHKWGRETFKQLKEAGVPGEYHTLQNTMHELTEIEINKLNEWILKILPPL